MPFGEAMYRAPTYRQQSAEAALVRAGSTKPGSAVSDEAICRAAVRCWTRMAVILAETLAALVAMSPGAGSRIRLISTRAAISAGRSGTIRGRAAITVARKRA